MKFNGTKRANFKDILNEHVITDTHVLNAFIWFCENIIINSANIKSPKKNYEAICAEAGKRFEFDDGDWFLFDEIVDKFAENMYKKVKIKDVEFYVYWWNHNSAPLFEIIA